MMYRSRGLSEKCNRRKAEPALSAIAAAVLLIAFSAYCGNYVRSDFIVSNDGVNDSNITITDSGIGLAVKYRETIKLFGDSVPAGAKVLNYTDITAGASDTFYFFYIDSLDRYVFCTEVKLNTTSATALAPRKFCEIKAPLDCYLHADKGESGTLISFVNRENITKRSLMLHNGVCSLAVDSVINSGWLFPSQCHMEEDTFLVVNSVDANKVMLRKIYSSGNTLKVAGSVEVTSETGSDGMYLLNSSVSYDGYGNVLVIWTRGKPSSDKYLNYRFFSRNLDGGPSGAFAEKAGDSRFSFYDDAGVAPYGEGKFAVVFWNSSGILMHQLEIDNGVVNLIPDQISNTAGARYCAASSNSNFLLIAVKGDLNNDGVASIEGFRYPVSEGVLGAAETFVYSNSEVPVDTVDRYKAAVNCVINSWGDFGVTWSSSPHAQGYLKGTTFGYRGVRFQRGFWTSPVDSLPVSTGDSIRFYPGIVDVSTLTDWRMLDSIRIGRTVTECRSNSWISMHDSSAMAFLPGDARFFQYRMEIVRNPGFSVDSLSTPSIKSVTIPWNGQPIIEGIDSLRTGKKRYPTISFGDTVYMHSRSDSALLYVNLFDYNNEDTLTLSTAFPAVKQSLSVVSQSGFDTVLTLLPLERSDTAVICTLNAVDNQGWKAVSKTLTLFGRNSVPSINASMVFTSPLGKRDTIELGKPSRYDLQEDDSLEFFYSVSDTNDQVLVRGFIELGSREKSFRVDSVGMGEQGRYVIRGDTLSIVDSFTVSVVARDPDTSILCVTRIRINHSPRIIGLKVGGRSVSDGEVLRAVPGNGITIQTTVSDTDCTFWDTLTYRFVNRDSTYSSRLTGNSFSHQYRPERGDSLLTVICSDIFGRSDTLRFSVRYPWFSIDTTHYLSAIDSLSNAASLIVGSGEKDTIDLPLLNSGTDTMHVTGIVFKGNSSRWLSVVIPQDSQDVVFTSENSSGFKPLLLPPYQPLTCSFIFSVERLLGDGILSDTVILFTSDPRHPSDTIPVFLEYNDLPRVISVNPDFIANVPYKPLGKRLLYRFPPHATIQISFSEPMDTALTRSGVHLCSVLDREFTGKDDPIGYNYTWSQNNTRLNLTPSYQKASPRFGFFPPEGLFIPTDSLEVVMTVDLTDVARTSQGPNRLDINNDFRRDSTGQQKRGMRVDSIGFSLLGIIPRPDSVLGLKPSITLVFSSPVYASSIDTSHKNNRFLRVHSRYSGSAPLSFDSISISSNRVTFRIAERLFYNDSMWCTYRGVSARDLMGFPADNDGDGIPSTLFDSSSTLEDVKWSYKVKGIEIVDVTPEDGTVVKDSFPRVTLRFSERILPGTIDSDTLPSNRSFIFSTLYSSERSGFSSIEFSRDSFSVTIQPKVSYFSGDVINCTFSGFASDYRYGRSVNLPADTVSVFSKRDWQYYSTNMGFYTYPNPYKPGKDPRHCRNSGPCGIWFKNLHNLRPSSTDLRIKIYNINAHPVFDSHKAGERIHLEPGNSLFKPQWFWDTRNQAGELVNSGLYLYSISNMKGKVLIKGKLIIVR